MDPGKGIGWEGIGVGVGLVVLQGLLERSASGRPGGGDTERQM